MANTLDYQSRDRKIDPPLLRSFGPISYDLIVGWTLNPSSLTHSLILEALRTLNYSSEEMLIVNNVKFI